MIRAETFVADLKGVDPRSLSITVIGGHSGTTILPPLSQSGFSFSDEEVASLTDRIQNAGTEVVQAKAGAGLATLSMWRWQRPASVALWSRACRAKAPTSVPTSSPVALTPVSLPSRCALARAAWKKYCSTAPWSAYEQAALDGMLDTLKGDIDKGVEFATS